MNTFQSLNTHSDLMENTKADKMETIKADISEIEKLSLRAKAIELEAMVCLRVFRQSHGKDNAAFVLQKLLDADRRLERVEKQIRGEI